MFVFFPQDHPQYHPSGHAGAIDFEQVKELELFELFAQLSDEILTQFYDGGRNWVQKVSLEVVGPLNVRWAPPATPEVDIVFWVPLLRLLPCGWLLCCGRLEFGAGAWRRVQDAAHLEE